MNEPLDKPKHFRHAEITDNSFERLMNRTHKVAKKHKELLNELEEEYFNRFGTYPDPLDDEDNFWTDLFHYGNKETFDFDEIIDQAEKLNPER